MIHDRHLWWGRTRIFDEEGRNRHAVVLLVIMAGAFSLAGLLLGDWSLRLIVSLLWFGLAWVYWLQRLHALFRPVNMLVPYLQRSLVRLTMQIWLICTLLVAGATTARQGLSDFFLLWSEIAALALLMVIWHCRVLRWRVVGLTVLVAASSLLWWQTLALPTWLAHTAGALVFGLLIALAWSSFNIALAKTAARSQGASRNRHLPSQFHQMLVRRMVKAALKPQPAGKASRPVPLATLLNAGYGWKFHWSAILFDWSFWLALLFAAGEVIGDSGPQQKVSSGLFFALIMTGRFIFHHISALYFNPVQQVIRFGSLRNKWDIIDSKRWDDTPGMRQGLLLLTPAMPRGKGLNLAIAAIGLRYFCVVWLVSMAICALALAPQPRPVQVHMLVLMGSVQAFMACLFLHDYARFWTIGVAVVSWKANMRDFLLYNLPWLVWFVTLGVMSYLPGWVVLGISLPWWVGMWFLGGVAVAIYRWRMLANAPSALPAGRLQS